MTLHQPHFLPWLPYILRIAVSDYFFVLDDVPYRKNYFQNRCRLQQPDRTPYWATIPVLRKTGYPISDLPLGITSERFIRKLCEGFRQSYSHAPYYHTIGHDIEEFLDTLKSQSYENLSDVSIASIKFSLRILKLPQPIFVKTSAAAPKGISATERLIWCAQSVESKTILNGWGASKSDDVHNADQLAAAGVSMSFLQRSYFMQSGFWKEIEGGLSSLHTALYVGLTPIHKLFEEVTLSISTA